MCGIAGLINLNGDPVSPALIQGMTDAIAHRGPDGEGQWIEGNVGIGHRRLAVIDLSPSGHQPMLSADGRWVLTFNGEIYNYRDLRVKLEAAGFRFRSTSDTEVVLYALVHWGAQALTRFNGMFALGLWDRRNQTMLLARDRYGIKPLYYSQQGDVFAFASEQKAILADRRFRARLDSAALLEYFTFQNLFTDRTLMEGIRLLKAGHYATIRLSAGVARMELVQYWDFAFEEPCGPTDAREYREELDRLFRQAVSRQLVSDVELGSYLSGGIDSGSITAVAARNYDDFKTFTCGFDLSSASGLELAYDERANAEALAAKFRTEHYEMVLKAGDMEKCLPRLVWHLEEPRVGQSYPNYYASQLASRFVKVVLSGAGGDELFGGYPWRYFSAPSSGAFEDYIDSYYAYWQRLVDNSTLKALFQPIRAEVDGVWTRDIFKDVFDSRHFAPNTPQDFVNLSLYLEAKTFLHGLLVVEDKLSMANSLETRVPFLDNDLVDFAMTCPVELKIRDLSGRVRIDENSVGNKGDMYFRRTHDGKQILRSAMEPYVTTDVAWRPKQGFSAPDASWFKGESIGFVRDMLLAKDARIANLLEPTVVRSLVDEHTQGQRNRRLLIWSMLCTEQWLRTEWR